MDNIRHGGTFRWKCQSCEAEAAQQQSVHDDDGDVKVGDNDEMRHDDDVIASPGRPNMESTRVDASIR